MTDALRKFLYEKDALGTATVIEVTPAELEALVSEIEAQRKLGHRKPLTPSQRHV